MLKSSSPGSNRTNPRCNAPRVPRKSVVAEAGLLAQVPTEGADSHDLGSLLVLGQRTETLP